ncbi:hypothetical protein BHY07_11035 [Bacillus subtilis subsp. subtilis]|nr:hypothetical protein QU35_11055 [Bacillus subtilis subsp. subtilis str. 168]AIY97634.1 hypothetical protein QX56_11045 [Bacillus subtilis]AJE94708.1 hypothetical protein RP72_10935 [Bacillus subtilis subsp. subtilis]AKC47583.1 hypothetical protein O7A_11045 [Bacillus subtilis KCTC 1028 = ATCC 6051a]APD21311.1 hypothetical protein phi3T_168 [Bacillus phage phi3T]EME05568.1 hypothetical protein BS732_3812 [Bacillus subtilis MB73/2]
MSINHVLSIEIFFSEKNAVNLKAELTDSYITVKHSKGMKDSEFFR